jgi:hypothetical protein
VKPDSARSCIVPDEMDDVRFSEESMADFLVMCAIPCDVVGQWLLKLAKRPATASLFLPTSSGGFSE